MSKRVTVASPPLPDRSLTIDEYAARELETKAAGRRAFWRSLSIACPDGHAPANVACWVIPNPDEPGAGQGVGFGPDQDKPVCCAKRASYAAALASA
jgi:hypothetical protein